MLAGLAEPSLPDVSQVGGQPGNSAFPFLAWLRLLPDAQASLVSLLGSHLLWPDELALHEAAMHPPPAFATVLDCAARQFTTTLQTHFTSKHHIATKVLRFCKCALAHCRRRNRGALRISLTKQQLANTIRGTARPQTKAIIAAHATRKLLYGTHARSSPLPATSRLSRTSWTWKSSFVSMRS